MHAMTRITLTGFGMAALCFLILSSTASAHLAVLPVVRCPATFAGGTPARTPAHLTTSSNTPTSGLPA